MCPSASSGARLIVNVFSRSSDGENVVSEGVRKMGSAVYSYSNNGAGCEVLCPVSEWDFARSGRDLGLKRELDEGGQKYRRVFGRCWNVVTASVWEN